MTLEGTSRPWASRRLEFDRAPARGPPSEARDTLTDVRLDHHGEVGGRIPRLYAVSIIGATAVSIAVDASSLIYGGHRTGRLVISTFGLVAFAGVTALLATRWACRLRSVAPIVDIALPALAGACLAQAAGLGLPYPWRAILSIALGLAVVMYVLAVGERVVRWQLARHRHPADPN